MNTDTAARLNPASYDRIATLESLLEHLQWAIELEHFTLPPYLCALYSLNAERNPEGIEVVASVFVEEMLHMRSSNKVRAAHMSKCGTETTTTWIPTVSS